MIRRHKPCPKCKNPIFEATWDFEPEETKEIWCCTNCGHVKPRRRLNSYRADYTDSQNAIIERFRAAGYEVKIEKFGRTVWINAKRERRTIYGKIGVRGSYQLSAYEGLIYDKLITKGYQLRSWLSN